MAIKNAPCKECQARQAGCHTICERYLAYHEECEARRKRRMKEYKAREYTVDNIFKRHWG